MDRRSFLQSGLMLAVFSELALTACSQAKTAVVDNANANSGITGATPANETATVMAAGVGDDNLPFKKVVKTDAEWKKILTPEQYEVARRAGTEAPYSSPLNNIHEAGTFTCVCCDLPLFSSATKFDSGTGWPSFYQPIAKINVRERVDKSLPGEERTEVLCNRCDAHVGHVFDDGPKPTGLRYCMNGVAMKFVKKGAKLA